MLDFHAYYEILAEIGDTSHPNWQSTTAGLIILRLVNDWLDFGRIGGTKGLEADPALVTAQYFIAAIPENRRVKQLLRVVVKKLETAHPTSHRIVDRPLAAYARTLAREGQFKLTYVALLPLLDTAERTKRLQAIGAISRQLGSAARLTGQFDIAEEHYHKAIHYAQKVRDHRSEWQARIGLRKIPLNQGNCSTIDVFSEELHQASIQTDDESLLSDFLHERAHLASLSGRPHESLTLLQRAMHFKRSIPRHRAEMIQVDVASLRLAVGDILVSKKNSLSMTLATREHPLRWDSLHNLMCVAIVEHDSQMFHLYRQALELAPLYPVAAIDYRRDASKGFRKFGDDALAEIELAKARRLATQYNIGNETGH